MHWELPEFILVSLIVVMCQSTLKYLLIRHLALILFCKFQISAYITAISNLGDIMITWEQDARTILLKIWVFLIILFIMLEVTDRLVSFWNIEYLKFWGITWIAGSEGLWHHLSQHCPILSSLCPDQKRLLLC